MQAKFMGTVLMALAAVCLVLPNVFAQEGMPPMGAPEEMKQLAKYSGSFDVQFEFKPAPEADWVPSVATCEFKMVLDGSAQQMLYDGDMMGMPLLGMGVTAYNRGEGKWQTTWIDNMMASIGLYEGEMTGNQLVVSGTEMMGAQEMLSRMTTTFVSDDEMTWLMEVSTDQGKTFSPGARATYTRQK